MAKHKQHQQSDAEQTQAKMDAPSTASTVQPEPTPAVAPQESTPVPAEGAPAPANGTGDGQPAKPQETKAQRFRRLANRRVPVALKRIEHVRNLTNHAQYEWTAEQAERILSALRAAVEEVARGFSGAKEKKNGWAL